MKNFKFKFSSILKLRRNLEFQSLRELGFSKKNYQIEFDKKIQDQESVKKSFMRIEKFENHLIHFRDYELEKNYIQLIQDNISKIEKNVQSAKEVFIQNLKNYNLAKKKVHMLEFFFNQFYQKYRKEFKAQEQRKLDDIHLIQFIRQKGKI